MTSAEEAQEASFASLVRDPTILRLIVGTIIGRLPLGMMTLAIIVVARDHGRSYAGAGLVVAVATVGTTVGQPFLGQSVDRWGYATILRRLAVAFPVGIAGLLTTMVFNLPEPLQLLTAFGAGAAVPPVGACMRALWPDLTGSGVTRSKAYAFEATMQQAAFIVGPVVVAWCVAIGLSALGLAVAGASGAAGALLFASARVTTNARRPRGGRLGLGAGIRALRPGGVQTVLSVCFIAAASAGAVEIAIPAFTAGHGSRASAGLVLGALAVGSLCGGIASVKARIDLTTARSYALAVGACALATSVLLIPRSITAMAAAAWIMGIPAAPALAAAYGLISHHALPGATTQTFGWLNASITSGAALGTAAGGLLIRQAGPHAALWLAVTLGSLASLAVTIRRYSLASVSTGETDVV